MKFTFNMLTLKKILIPSYFPKEQLKKLCALLGGNENFRMAGGCVRDLLYDERCNDIDIACTYTPEHVMSILNNHSIKTILKGVKFGTITAILDGHQFEITTLRQDINCDGRHANVKFTHSWEEDAKRRDFTINAMYLDLDGNVYDYFNGLTDLENNYIRFVGDPAKRVSEDYLRILRYFRFYALFDCKKIDHESFHQCKMQMKKLDLISGERIRDELLKMLKAPYASKALSLITTTDFPNIIYLDVFNPYNEPLSFSSEDDDVNLTLLIMCFEKVDIDKLFKRLKISNKSIKAVKFLLSSINDFLNFSGNYKHYCFTIGKESFLKLLNLRHHIKNIDDYQDIKQTIITWTMPEFPLNGTDIIKKYKVEKEKIGDLLAKAKDKWIKSDFSLPKQSLLQHLDREKN